MRPQRCPRRSPSRHHAVGRDRHGRAKEPQREKEDDVDIEYLIDEGEIIPHVPASIIKQKKRKLKVTSVPSVFDKKDEVEQETDDKIIIPPIDMEVRDTVFKTPRKRKTAVVLPIAHGNFNIKNIDKKLPRKRNKIVYGVQ